MELSRSLARTIPAAAFPLAAAAQPHFSELLINPAGPDQGFESIELGGDPGVAMTDHWIIVIDGNGSGAGIVTQLIDLSGTSIGAGGLLLIRDDPAVGTLPTPDPASPVLGHDFEPDLDNGSATYVLALGSPWFTQSFDFDYDNDGVMDSPLFMTTLDAVSITDGGQSDREYAAQLGGTRLGLQIGASRSYTPDALYRLLTAAGDVHGWAGGDVEGPTGGPWNWVDDQSFGFELACLSGVGNLTLDLGSENFRFLPYADCDVSTGPGVLDIFDVLCFVDAFVRGDAYACECDTSTGPEGCDIFDFLCFQRAFLSGCR